MALSSSALRLLDAIEAAEMRSLEWGYVDGSLSESDILRLPDVNSTSHQVDDATEELIEARAVLEITVAGATRIRSRFAEMIRLLVTNRQLFPNKPWQSAPHLVSDFRVDRRPRRFPRRDRVPQMILTSQSASLGATPLRVALWTALTARPGMLLAGFQERATYRLSSATDDGGTIVTAGTGSGKTLAFYLPAMVRIGEAITGARWVKALAIYPRVELLKDQFAEAFKMARTIDGSLATLGRRPLVLGALFGATPATASAAELADRGWPRRGESFVCPWARCPTCGGELLWANEDLGAGRERLVCSRRECDGSISEDHIVLTRRRLQQLPPDILFTTTEILNQRLSDHWMRRLFGVGSPRTERPFLALLDEVHTYEGASGAQAALTLRRWRHLLASPVSWVGLSATLGDAARFFSDLTGAHPDRVVEITPTPEELIEEGAEYQILLRGDAASRSSLLSTTIQSSILIPRLLDPPGSTSASGAFGRRAFLFTDDLDVTNRLFDDLRDAEGYTIFGKVDPQRRPLAALRENGADAPLRDLQGQRWRFCEDIGHPLDRPLVVGRTTSQDGGVSPLANVIVATSTLEVGFNDPFVGAVIQHKAPRGMGSFLQRKGRAGRDRNMRPIMLTVLSDYGRDRAFYQAYEHLFDPHLDPQHLPVRNPYILRIQAAFALIDWMSARTAGPDRAWLWDILSRPRPEAAGPQQRVIAQCRALLARLVEGDTQTISDLSAYLAASLVLDEAGVISLLWEPPRSILMEVVPTLLRRLVLNWRLAFPAPGSSHDIQVDYHPLPDFVPRNLFSDLSLPEVRIITPAATVNHSERTDVMPIVQALSQLAPGRVTRRFAFERGGLSHWAPVDPALPEQTLSIGDYAEDYEFVGSFRSTVNENADGDEIRVYRPWSIRLEKVDRSVALPSSNSRLSWRSDLAANGDPVSVPISPRSAWRPYVARVDFHLHRFRSSVSVRRFAPAANATIRTLTDDFSVAVTFGDAEGRPAALGFEIEVDGFRLDLSGETMNAMSASPLTPALLQSSRLAYLKDRFRADSALPADLNDFQRDWLFQILVSALLADAHANDRELEESAADLLQEDRLLATFGDVMTTLFGDTPPQDLIDGSDESDDEEEGGQAVPHPSAGRSPHSRLQQALDIHLGDPVVRQRLRALADELAAPEPEAFARWLQVLLLDTLGEAMLQACVASAPRQATLDTLLIDIRSGPDGASVWITESTLGGAGVLEAFAERFGAEPRLFFAAVEAALAPTDLEMVDSGLQSILQAARSDRVVADLMALLRATSSHSERAAHWRTLSQHLGRQGGIDLSHALSVAVNARLLRSGAGPDLDALLVDLQREWDAIEGRFGVSVGLREFAFICSRAPNLSARVRAFLGAHLPSGAASQATVMGAVTNLLWPREAEVRSRTLQSYNPYRQARATDPGVVRHLLSRQSTPPIPFEDADWHSALVEAFQTYGLGRLSADTASLTSLRAAIVRLLATPIDVGVLQFFPTVEKLDRMAGSVIVTLTLREQL